MRLQQWKIAARERPEEAFFILLCWNKRNDICLLELVWYPASLGNWKNSHSRTREMDLIAASFWSSSLPSSKNPQRERAAFLLAISWFPWCLFLDNIALPRLFEIPGWVLSSCCQRVTCWILVIVMTDFLKELEAKPHCAVWMHAKIGLNSAFGLVAWQSCHLNCSGKIAPNYLRIAEKPLDSGLCIAAVDCPGGDDVRCLTSTEKFWLLSAGDKGKGMAEWDRTKSLHAEPTWVHSPYLPDF